MAAAFLDESNETIYNRPTPKAKKAPSETGNNNYVASPPVELRALSLGNLMNR